MIPPDAFIQRTQELADLSQLTARPGPALVLVYGRRRVGKTALMRHWAAASGRPTFYWEAPKRATADHCRTYLVQELWRWHNPEQGVSAPRFEHWKDVFREMRRVAGDQACNIILDEFPWAVEADASLPSYLKNAWDEIFADSQVKLVISGSHISAMEKLMQSDAPLYGRLTGKLLVRPFRFTEVTPFMPRYGVEQRLAAYSILGGIPDYLRYWDDHTGLLTNIRKFFLSDLSPYRNEKDILISDVLRLETPDYESVLAAVGEGRHEAEAIARETNLPSSRVGAVLSTLCDVRLVERRIRASLPPAQHARARNALYLLCDPFLQFFYRFIAPHRSQIAQGLYGPVEAAITANLRSFVGSTFEQLCRDWALVQARAAGLPFDPDFVGSDWLGAEHQADLVAVAWKSRQLLVGEAKWEDHATKSEVLTELKARADKVEQRLKRADPRRKDDWHRYYMLFSRRGVTAALSVQAAREAVRVVTFAELVRDLEQAPDTPVR